MIAVGQVHANPSPNETCFQDVTLHAEGIVIVAELLEEGVRFGGERIIKGARARFENSWTG